MKRFSLLLFFIFILSIAPSIMVISAQEKVNRPEWKIGDQWTYQRGDQQVTLEVVAMEQLDGTEHYVVQRLANKILFTKDIENCGTKTPSGDFITKLKPPQKLYSWPLEVGKKWKEKLRIFWDTTRWGQEGFNWDPDPIWRESKVLGIEKVTVPAGTFYTFHVYATETMRGVTVEYHRWYSPEVKNAVWAKGYSRGVPWEEKLISYSLK